ncbi:putative SAC3 GANP family [Trypanosoma vivax]|uniref:Uncharacterized protein n=1 Tax=Trypanosoma vivax (strain Y486) TaxID=1055687 RepID=G0TWA6_TRYVY|nr:hypothetical protein TRVL_04068 [Trypanosoma vivax]KAH8604031.1 putative SAC3 GANP family [Trypanosoma vivax]CCC48244.1 conserved hypothetical protein [Trypanosoma vivax Y486]
MMQDALGVRAALSKPPFAAFCEFKVDEPPRRGQLAALCSGGNSANHGDAVCQLPPVEPYGRSAAGLVVEPASLRTPTALEKSMHFLVQHYLRDPHAPVIFLAPFEVWRYLWDRMRQVRTNWVPQLPPVGSELNPSVSSKRQDTLRQGACGECSSKQRTRNESRRRLQWLEFTVAALAVGGANLCRSVEGCRRFMQEKQNFLESIAQCFSDLVLSYRAEQRLRNSEMFSAIILFYGLSQLTKIENRAGFYRVMQVTVNSFSPVNGSASPVTTMVFEPPSSSVDFGSVYRELAYIPCMARSRHVRIALRLIHCWCQREWFRFFYICRNAPLTLLQRAMLTHSFSYARFRAVVDLVTANVVVYGKGRVRGSIAVGELADLLLMRPPHCVELLITMGLGQQLTEDRMYLRVAQQDSSPYITQEQIHRHLEETGGKSRLCLPTVPSFVGFEVWKPAFELFPDELDVSSVGSSGAGAPPITHLENMRCPVNLMQLLEPYCPPYNSEVAALRLIDAGNEWFSGIQKARRQMLMWCLRRGLPGGRVPTNARKLGDSDGDCDKTETSEEVQRALEAMDSESLSTNSSVLDSDCDETWERVDLPYNDASCDDDEFDNNKSCKKSEEGNEEDDVVGAACVLLQTLLGRAVYSDFKRRKLESDAASISMEKEVCEISSTETGEDVINVESDELESETNTTHSGLDQRSPQALQSTTPGNTEVSVKSPPSNRHRSVTALVDSTPQLEHPWTVGCPGEPSDTNKNGIDLRVKNQTESKSTVSAMPHRESVEAGPLVVPPSSSLQFDRYQTFTPYKVPLPVNASTQSPLRDGDEKMISTGTFHSSKDPAINITTVGTPPFASFKSSQEQPVFSGGDKLPSTVQRAVTSSSGSERERKRRIRAPDEEGVEVEREGDNKVPLQRPRLEQVVTPQETKYDCTTAYLEGSVTPVKGTKLDVAVTAPTGRSLTYRDVIKLHLLRKRRKEGKGEQKGDYELRHNHLRKVDEICYSFSNTCALLSGAETVNNCAPLWVAAFTKYLLNFYTASCSDAAACRLIADVICQDPHALALAGWLCHGFTPSMGTYVDQFQVHMPAVPILRLTSRIVVIGTDARGVSNKYYENGSFHDSVWCDSSLAHCSLTPVPSLWHGSISLGRCVAAALLSHEEKEQFIVSGTTGVQLLTTSRLFGHGLEESESDQIGLWEQLHSLRTTSLSSSAAVWRLLSSTAAARRRPFAHDAMQMRLYTQISLHAVNFEEVNPSYPPRENSVSTADSANEEACHSQRDHFEHSSEYLTVIIALDLTNPGEYETGMESIRCLLNQVWEGRVTVAGFIVVLRAETAEEGRRKKRDVEELFRVLWREAGITEIKRNSSTQDGEQDETGVARDEEFPAWRGDYQKTIRETVIRSKGDVTMPPLIPRLSKEQPCQTARMRYWVKDGDTTHRSCNNGNSCGCALDSCRQIGDLVSSNVSLPSGAPEPLTLVLPTNFTVSGVKGRHGSALRQCGDKSVNATNDVLNNMEELSTVLCRAVSSLLDNYEKRWQECLRTGCSPVAGKDSRNSRGNGAPVTIN